jgi:hypothetical protein
MLGALGAFVGLALASPEQGEAGEADRNRSAGASGVL